MPEKDDAEVRAGQKYDLRRTSPDLHLRYGSHSRRGELDRCRVRTPALTRKERAENVRKRNYWTKYGDKARNVLNAILDKYAETGIEAIEDMKVLTVPPITDIGTPKEIIDSFGGKPQYLQAIRELEAEIYKVA